MEPCPWSCRCGWRLGWINVDQYRCRLKGKYFTPIYVRLYMSVTVEMAKVSSNFSSSYLLSPLTWLNSEKSPNNRGLVKYGKNCHFASTCDITQKFHWRPCTKSPKFKNVTQKKTVKNNNCQLQCNNRRLPQSTSSLQPVHQSSFIFKLRGQTMEGFRPPSEARTREALERRGEGVRPPQFGAQGHTPVFFYFTCKPVHFGVFWCRKSKLGKGQKYCRHSIFIRGSSLIPESTPMVAAPSHARRHLLPLGTGCDAASVGVLTNSWRVGQWSVRRPAARSRVVPGRRTADCSYDVVRSCW